MDEGEGALERKQGSEGPEESARKVRVADVAPDVPVPGIETVYTYTVPQGMEVSGGDAVLVPFGRRYVVGYVVRVREVLEEELGFSPERLRSLYALVEGVSLPASLQKTLEFVSEEYLCPLGSTVAVAIPPGLRSRIREVYELKEEELGADGLSESEREWVDRLRAMGGVIPVEKVRALLKGKEGLARLVEKGVVTRRVYLKPERDPVPSLWRLTDPGEVERFIREEASKKPSQVACLLALSEAPKAELTLEEIKALTGSKPSVLRALRAQNLLVPVEPVPEERFSPAPSRLTPEQSTALSPIVEAIQAHRHEVFLLFGVTGSGKTEIYLRAIAESLARGRRALYLVPEIALTAHVVSVLRQRFGSGLAVMHSGLASGERLRQWRRVLSGEAPLVLGARSALFSPLENIGVIVMDEEHETGYKQDHAPRYQTRRVAEFRARESQAVLILGSATPSLESFYASEQGWSRRLVLGQRATAVSLPSVTVVDLREVFKGKEPSLFSPELREGIEEALSSREQVMLFVNRRAFATALLCRDCGYVPRCVQCSVSLSLHRREKAIRCHHCGHQERAPDVCPRCGSYKLRPLGVGTQKVEEFAQKEFPQARVARLDRDTAGKKGVLESIFGRLRSGEIDILVGTQMIAKGLDFPNVSLVGVVTADTALSIPDFRATERTFQLLTQMAGRAGRHKPGRVIIQTFQPEHPAVRLARTQDYEEFYRQEIRMREEAQYPPVVRLINIVSSSPSPRDSDALIEDVARALRPRKEITLVGPAECPLERLQGKYRRHLLVKLPLFMPPEVAKVPEELLSDRRGQVLVDVDPVSLL